MPPIEVIPGIILVIHEEGFRLTRLNIWAPPPRDLSFLVPEEIQMANCHEVFESLQFCATRRRQRLLGFHVFHSTGITRIDSDFNFLYEDTRLPFITTGLVILCYLWPELETVTISCPVPLRGAQKYGWWRSVVAGQVEKLYLSHYFCATGRVSGICFYGIALFEIAKCEDQGAGTDSGEVAGCYFS
ncbi:hypothetical protein BP6252_05905 [Coleophoma cylindrospora]|uniref:Uncharacterized protein n=1 Tax=Coleophoma cylindrospora TaxID=1849047 RepID=A0A3D8RL50_9HELO|nr:hypothetical protein BP6252_05905 [Coleophoma cylindrospora]